LVCGSNSKRARRKPWFRSRPALILAVLIGGALIAQQTYPVSPKYQRQPAIQATLDRVDAARDEWTGEQDFEELQKKVKEAVAAQSGITSRFRKLSLVEAKIVESGRAAAGETEAKLKVRVEFGGEAAEGGLLSLLGHWDMVWERGASGWKMRELLARPLRESRSARAWFEDVTEAAIGHNKSWKRQLSLSVDHFRGLLDEAAGVDVYGHQGIAVGDYDGDGLEDLYVLQPGGLPNRLFHNDGGGRFSDRTKQAGLNLLDDSRAALFADLDNDGDQDLIVITPSRVLLFRNSGGVFTLAANSGFRVPAGASLTSAALADYDGDGLLDLYVCSYDFWSPGQRYNSPTPYYDATNGPPNYLFRNRGNLVFEDATERAGLNVNNNRYSFAAAWGDYDGDGRPDLYVANDFGRKNLYHNNGDGTFRDVSAEAGAEDPGAGMSAAWGDYDNDGRPDLYVGNMWSSAGQRLTGNRQFAARAGDRKIRELFQRHARGNSLLANRGVVFQDVTLDAGVEMGRWAWASGFADFDNDGWDDLFVQNGYITGTDTRDL
jgi:hypothetical protein